MGRAVGDTDTTTIAASGRATAGLTWASKHRERSGSRYYEATADGFVYSIEKAWGRWDLDVFDSDGKSVKERTITDLPNLKTAKFAAEVQARGTDISGHMLKIWSEKLGKSPIRGHGMIWGGVWKCSCGAGQRRYEKKADAAVDAWEHWRNAMTAQLS